MEKSTRQRASLSASCWPSPSGNGSVRWGCPVLRPAVGCQDTVKGGAGEVPPDARLTSPQGHGEAEPCPQTPEKRVLTVRWDGLHAEGQVCTPPLSSGAAPCGAVHCHRTSLAPPAPPSQATPGLFNKVLFDRDPTGHLPKRTRVPRTDPALEDTEPASRYGIIDNRGGGTTASKKGVSPEPQALQDEGPSRRGSGGSHEAVFPASSQVLPSNTRPPAIRRDTQ